MEIDVEAEGLPDWQQPDREWTQTDEHPVVKVSRNQAVKLCEWLIKVTGKEWRLPTNAEWEAAVGSSTYPWGDYFPPDWDDGNYAILADGKDDPKNPKANRVLRRGYWFSFAPSASRHSATPAHAHYDNGFRLVRGRLQSGEAGSR